MATESRLTLNWSEIAAGAIAALSGAVTATLLGVYGTLVGAGIMSAVTTVVGTVSHHYLGRTRSRLQQIRHDVRQERGAIMARTRAWQPRRVKELVGGAALVGGTAVATLAAVQVVAGTPAGQEFIRNASPARAQPVVMVEPDGDGGASGSPESGDDTFFGHGDSSGSSGPSGPAPAQEPQDTVSPAEGQSASKPRQTTAPDPGADTSTPRPSVEAPDGSTSATEAEAKPEPEASAPDAPSPAPDEPSAGSTPPGLSGEAGDDVAGDSAGESSSGSTSQSSDGSSGESAGSVPEGS